MSRTEQAANTAPAVDKTHAQALSAVVERAVELAGKRGVQASRMTLTIDLLSADKHCPMDFSGLATARDQDVAHDVFGIIEHLDRTTGRLQGEFTPRYAR